MTVMELRGRISVWRGLLDRPLTSYYLVLGITVLLLGLGLVMVQSTASVVDLSAGLSAWSDFKKQLLGTAVGLPAMWLAARSSPRVFRALAYPLLAVAVVGLLLTLIHGVSAPQNGAARWISIGGQQFQPSEIAKLALVLWGADLLARKEKLGQLADWRHMLVPLMPGAGVLCLLVMTGDDLGTTFILLIIFLALLWVIGTPGRVFAGMLILMALAMSLMIVSKEYRFQRMLGYLNQQASPGGANWQGVQGRYAIGSGGIFGVGLGSSGQKWGYVPESTSDFIFAIIGEELGLVGTLCVTFLYGGLAFAGLRIARRVPDLFSRLAATADRDAGRGEHRRGDRRAADHRGAAAPGLGGPVLAARDPGRPGHADVVRQVRARRRGGFGRTRPRLAASRSKLARSIKTPTIRTATRHEGNARRWRLRRPYRTGSRACGRPAAH
jgi:cell division protein FtsW